MYAVAYTYQGYDVVVPEEAVEALRRETAFYVSELDDPKRIVHTVKLLRENTGLSLKEAFTCIRGEQNQPTQSGVHVPIKYDVTTMVKLNKEKLDMLILGMVLLPESPANRFSIAEIDQFRKELQTRRNEMGWNS